MHDPFDLSDVRRFADAHRIDHVLRNRNRLRVGAVGGRLRFLVEFLITRGLGRRVELEGLDLCFLETANDFLESFGRRALCLGAKERKEQSPVARGPAGPDVDRADPRELAEG